MIFTLFRALESDRVVTYTVHENGEPAADRIDRAEELVFVKDGFNFSAAVGAPLWLLANGLWPALVGYLVIAGALLVGLPWLGVGGLWSGLGLALLHLLIGAEADTLRRFNLELQGWRAVGTVVGRNIRECERRFFDDWLPQQPLMRLDGGGVGGGVASAVPEVIGAVGDAVASDSPERSGAGRFFRRPHESSLGLSRIRRWMWLGN